MQWIDNLANLIQNNMQVLLRKISFLRIKYCLFFVKHNFVDLVPIMPCQNWSLITGSRSYGK